MALPNVQSSISRLRNLRSKSTSSPSRSGSTSRSPSPLPSMSSPSTREIGTLIVVVLKANHLPNKRHIGKQDPYCVVTVNGQKQRTKALKKGGQHPEWDEELRFKVYEEEIPPPTDGSGNPPTPPPKDGKPVNKIQGGTKMRLACFADDLREPDFIGETDVDLTEVLTKGETDEWFTLMNRDRFAGKVYLELTFWSNDPPPQKKATPTPVANRHDYGGQGSFVPSGEQPHSQNRIVSTGALHDHHRRLSESIRPSSSMLDLYQPPYERNHNSAIETLNHGFGELSAGEPRRSDTYPPAQNGYRAPSPAGYSAFSSQPSHVYEASISSSSTYSYDRPVTPTGPSNFRPRTSMSSQQLPFPSQPPYQADYDSSSTGYRPSPPARGPRYSIPASSSGFVPLSNSSGFSTLSSLPSEPSGFAPPVSHTPTSAPYNTHFNPNSYSPAPPHTPAPGSYLTGASSNFYDNGPLPEAQYPQYGAASAPPQHLPPPPPSNGPLLPQSAPPMPYGTYNAGLPDVSPLPHSSSLSSSSGPGGSRPLPTPQGPSFNNIPASASQPLGSYSPSGLAPPFPNGFPSVPPPPPLQPSHSSSPISQSPRSHSPSTEGHYEAGPPLPRPPPQPPYSSQPPHRRASLPVPPAGGSSRVGFQQLPPPPPPLDYHNIPPPPLPPSHSGHMYHPGPPPQPPAPLNGYSQPPTSISYGGY
ncbi:calcineurin temperature suppressor cts1 [Moniliophthora roreri MCA 2997]|uniref:Calcineurin temperature suppressor cts1 n=1 Tax=Moniliophthora roreri (strain MCA 2997) TaxID=1381753 RepID=V2XUH6_MONRO|nr:calcineurin temperature suppressor cts1 [Moniliophthora roreri MCA 2997]KAI3612550.1 calcineurin temperature suppressor cts1 [Moniliophthora roreri]